MTEEGVSRAAANPQTGRADLSSSAVHFETDCCKCSLDCFTHIGNNAAVFAGMLIHTVRVFAWERQARPACQSPAVKNFHLPSGEMPMR